LSRKQAASEISPSINPATGGPTTEVEQHGIQSQGVRKVVAVVDQNGNQRQAQRRVEGVEHAKYQGHQNDQDRPDQFEPGQGRQHAGLKEEQHLGQHQQAAPVVPVDPGAGQRPHHQDRRQRGEGGDPQQGCRTGQAIHQPGQRDLLDPRAEDGYRPTNKIKPE
jgi:hypothetical protein